MAAAGEVSGAASATEGGGASSCAVGWPSVMAPMVCCPPKQRYSAVHGIVFATTGVHPASARAVWLPALAPRRRHRALLQRSVGAAGAEAGLTVPAAAPPACVPVSAPGAGLLSSVPSAAGVTRPRGRAACPSRTLDVESTPCSASMALLCRQLMRNAMG